MPSEPLTFQGDTIRIPFKFDQDITSWKIRSEFYDKAGNSIKMANTASGGSDAEIIITDGINGDFTVIIAKNLTDDFKSKCWLEVKIEDTASPTNKYTVHKGYVDLQSQQITWTDPNE